MSENTEAPDHILTGEQLSNFIRPTEYVCASCGQKVKGEIPFKMHHLYKCVGKNKTKTTPPPPAPPTELKRMLRAKASKS